MEELDYKALYKLQDQVLKLVFQVEKEFYLTGGTCLSRFYQEKRYSDDLDFFANDSSRFSFALKNAINNLNAFLQIETIIQARSFCRIKVNQSLQVDFVNDIAYRFQEPIKTSRGYLIDSVENILSNKITAILGRDNPKDIFDLYLISKFYSFEWDEIISSAKKKLIFQEDDLIARLKSFPPNLLANLKLIDDKFLNRFNEEFPMIIEEIINHSKHISMNIGIYKTE